MSGTARSDPTNQRIEGGGEYFIISRSFGMLVGAAIGVVLSLSQAISVAFYTPGLVPEPESRLRKRGMPYSRRSSCQPPSAQNALSQTALAEVRRIVLDAIGEGQATVYLFGSWARGEATPLSDIDVAIEPHSSLPRGVLAQLRERLEESHIPYHVDVVDLRRTAAAFRCRVRAEGIQWSA